MLEINIIAFLYLSTGAVFLLWAALEFESAFTRVGFVILMSAILYFVLHNLYTCHELINRHGRIAFMSLAVFLLMAIDDYLEKKLESEDDEDA